MAKVKPFNAVIFNQEQIKDLSSVVCPPYDVISPEKQEAYYKADPYNFIRILLTKDHPDENKYKLAADCFKDWQKNQVLIQDNSPCIYFYSQQYKLKGEKKTRYGFLALLHLGNRDSGVFGHEHTRLAAKEDRLKLLKQVKANLSPIFVIFQDKKRIISRIKDKYIKNDKLFIDITDEEKTVHKVWRLDSPDILSVIQSSMSEENIFIADGHHRYEVACAYRDELVKRSGNITGEESFNYILAYFTNIDARGLTVMPIHRLVKFNQKISTESFKAGLKEFFDCEEIKDKGRFFFLMSKAGVSEHIIGMYKDKRYYLLRLRNIKILDKLIQEKPPAYRELDVSILNYAILKKILGLDIENKELINFSHDEDELISQADTDSSYMAFFLNPVKVQQIMTIAQGGEKMPSKSTYFYPKVLSGLVINKLNEK